MSNISLEGLSYSVGIKSQRAGKDSTCCVWPFNLTQIGNSSFLFLDFCKLETEIEESEVEGGSRKGRKINDKNLT